MAQDQSIDMKKISPPLFLILFFFAAETTVSPGYAQEPDDFNLADLQYQLNKTKSELARLLTLQQASFRNELGQMRGELEKLKREMDRIRIEIEVGIKEMEADIAREKNDLKAPGKYDFESGRLKQEMDSALQNEESKRQSESQSTKADISKSMAEMKKTLQESVQLKQVIDAALKIDLTKLKAESAAAKDDFSQSKISMKNIFTDLGLVNQNIAAAIKNEQTQIRVENKTAKQDIFESRAEIAKTRDRQEQSKKDVFASLENKKQESPFLAKEKSFPTKSDILETAKPRPRFSDATDRARDKPPLPEKPSPFKATDTASTPVKAPPKKPRDLIASNVDVAPGKPKPSRSAAPVKTPVEETSLKKQDTAKKGTDTIAALGAGATSKKPAGTSTGASSPGAITLEKSTIASQAGAQKPGSAQKIPAAVTPVVQGAASPKNLGKESANAPDANAESKDSIEEKMTLYANTIQNLKDSISTNSGNISSQWMALGKANLESERYIKSLKPEERYKLIHKDQYAFGSHAIAILSFKRALTLNPGDANLHYLLGETYDEMNDGRNASAYVESAKRLYEKKGDRKMAAKAGEYAQSLQKKYTLQYNANASSPKLTAEQN